MPKPPAKVQGRAKLNGQVYRQLDPKILKMAEFLDRAIRSQDTTVGVVVSAVGVLLGRKVMNATNLEQMSRDVTMAMRVGYYLASASREGEK
jgi:hypothetical protein